MWVGKRKGFLKIAREKEKTEKGKREFEEKGDTMITIMTLNLSS